MNFFEKVTGNVTKAVDYVVEKNRKAALVNRIRIVIKNERENQNRAYVALGKYYFENLRDCGNEEIEHFCNAVEASELRMKKAFTKLDELTAPESYDDDECTCCDCSSGCCGNSDKKEELTDVQEEPYDDDFPPALSIVDMANESTDTASEEAFSEEAADDEAGDPEYK